MIWYQEELKFDEQPVDTIIQLVGLFKEREREISIDIYLSGGNYNVDNPLIANFYNKIISQGLTYEDITSEMLCDKT